MSDSKIKAYRKEIEDWVVDKIEGSSLPWVKGWNDNKKITPPLSGATGKVYDGQNFWKLLEHSQVKEQAVYVTYNQAKKLGYAVKKGAKALNIKHVTYKTYDKNGNAKDPQSTGNVEDNPKDQYSVPIVSMFNVFNIADTTIPIVEIKPEQSNKNIKDILDKNEVHYRESTISNKAYYSPSDNLISLPSRDTFNSEAEYNAAVLHELVHWSGHKNRLDRDFTVKHDGNKEKMYAQEELVAEVGAFMLAAKMGIETTETNSIAYSKGWAKTFDKKEDRVNAIITGMREADKAIDYLTKDKIHLKFNSLESALNNENLGKEEKNQEDRAR